MMMGYDGSNYTVWFHTYEEAKEFVDKSVLNNQQALIRLKVDVATIEFL
jgi:viroplasmin and RNaseH domain-containing protein